MRCWVLADDVHKCVCVCVCGGGGGRGGHLCTDTSFSQMSAYVLFSSIGKGGMGGLASIAFGI
jgi:hypothetical protein